MKEEFKWKKNGKVKNMIWWNDKYNYLINYGEYLVGKFWDGIGKAKNENNDSDSDDDVLFFFRIYK